MNDSWNILTPLLSMPPLIDMMEMPEGVRLYCNLPGITADEVSLTVEGEFLYVRAEARFPPIRGKIHALEFSDTLYEGRILLPAGDIGRMEASLSNGVLRIFIPFPSRKEAIRIPVTAG